MSSRIVLNFENACLGILAVVNKNRPWMRWLYRAYAGLTRKNCYGHNTPI